MKKYFLIVLIALLLICSACSDTGVPENTSSAGTATPVPTATPEDFSGTDFSGIWSVSQIIDSEGNAVDDTEMQALGADFTLELLAGETYFVYDASGSPLGQGTYAISLNLLTLTAGNVQTVYEIEDSDTLRCPSDDGSITVMKRSKEDMQSDDALTEDTDSADGLEPDNLTEDTAPADETTDTGETTEADFA